MARWFERKYRQSLINPEYLLPYYARFGAGTNNTSSGAAGRVFLTPVLVEVPLTISNMSCRITTSGGAGTFFRMGLYKGITTGTPEGGTLLVDSGDIDAHSGVPTPKRYVFTTPIRLEKGWYWFALETPNTTIAFQRYGDNNFFEFSGDNLFFQRGAQFDQAFGALPVTCPAVVSAGGVGKVLCAFRISEWG